MGSRWNEARRTHEAAAAWWDGQAWNEVAGLAGGTELHDVAGAPDADGWAVGRAGVDARVTRVCGRPQAGLFGGSEPFGDDEPTTIVGADPGCRAGRDRGRGGGRGGSRPRCPKRRACSWPASASPSSPSTAHPGAPDRAAIGSDRRAGTSRRKAGVAESTSTYGAIDADFDGDGDPDLYIGRHGRPARLLLNDGGQFVDHEAIRFGREDRHGCTAMDVDRSGLPDLYCVIGASRGSGLKANELWLDPGSEHPTEVAMAAGLLDATGRGRTTTFLRSGRREVELVVANSPVRVDGLPSIGRTWKTTGDGSFVSRQRPGFAAGLGGLDMQASDYDRDGRDDLLLVTGGLQAPMAEGTRIYRNTSSGLRDVTRRLGVDRSTRSTRCSST